MIEEARKKADFEAKAMMGNQSSSALRHFSPDYHAALDCSTPSVYRNSIKLPFGTNTGFQDYIPSLNQLDNYEMTPSNFNHNFDKASQSSEVFTYGGSSAAPLFSEMFNPDLYEVEKVVDSNDQSPMGKSQSQMSELQFKQSNKGGFNTREANQRMNAKSYSISDLDFASSQNQKTKFSSIVQNSSSVANAEQHLNPITDVR